MVLLAGGTPVPVPCPQNNGFKMRPEDLDAAITPQTKWLILNSPKNPTGAAYTEAELKALTDVLVRHPQVWVMTDDMYEHLVYDDFGFTTTGPGRAAALRAHADRQRRLEGLCMTGWRIGYRGRAEGADQGDGRDPVAVDPEPVLDQPGGGGRGAERPAGFHPGAQPQLRGAARPRRRHAEPGAGPALPAARGRLLRLSVLRRRHRQAHPGRTDDRRATRTSSRYLLRRDRGRGGARQRLRPSPYFRISYATSTEVLRDACNRIDRACRALA